MTDDEGSTKKILEQRTRVLTEFARLQQLETSWNHGRVRWKTFEVLRWATDVAAAAAMGDHTSDWHVDRVWETIQEPTRRDVAQMIVSAAVAFQQTPDRRLLICELLADRLLPLGGPDALVEDPTPLQEWLAAWHPESSGTKGKKNASSIMAEIAARYGAFGLPKGDYIEKHRKNIAKSLKNAGFDETAAK